jgi:hypothetical protein
MSAHTPGSWIGQAIRDAKLFDARTEADVIRAIYAHDELLAALQGAAGWLERYAGDTSDTSRELWRHIDAARAAIAKAVQS